MAKDVANYVFRGEAINVATRDGENISASIARGNNLYVMTTEWKYDDSGMYGEDIIYPEAKTGTVVENAVEEVAEETVSDEAETTDEAEATDEAATEKIATTDVVLDGTEMDIMPIEDEFVETTGTATVRIRSIDSQGNSVYEYEKTYGVDVGIYGMQVAVDGTVYYILDEYGYTDNEYTDEYSVVCIDPTGKELWTNKLEGRANEGAYFYVQNLVVQENGVIAVSSLGIEAIDKSGKSAGLKVLQNIDSVGNVVMLKDGRIAATIYGESNIELQILDVNTGTFGEKIEVPFNIYTYSFYPGAPAYDIVLSGQDGIYYYNVGDSAPTKVMDYVASDLVTTSLDSPAFLDENTFIAGYYDELAEKYDLYKFTKVDPSTIANKETLMLGGMWIDTNVRRMVVKFNRNNDNYRILLKDYSNGGDFDDFNEVIKEINNDIVTGNMPDIMFIDSSLDISSYLAKGVFSDIDSFIEKDPQIKKEDYLENVFNAVSYKGKAYAVIPSFSVSTLIGKEKLVGKRTNWTVSDFINFIDSQNSDASPMGLMTKQDFIYSIMCYASSDYVDKDSDKVNFDSQEFIDLLEFTKRYPNEIDYDEFDDSYWMEQDAAYRNDETLLFRGYLYNFRDSIAQTTAYFGEPVSYVGYPTSSGSGSSINADMCIAINAKSKYQDASWEFIRQFLMDDFQNESVYSFPIKKSALEEMAKNSMKANAYIDDEGNEVEYNDNYWINGMEIEILPPTQADIDQVMGVIKSANSLTNYSQNIIEIINEEAQSFYNGQKSAAEVAKIINGRVQIYVNENR